MNWCNMSIQVPLLKKTVVTNFTFELLISSLNRCNMFFQVTLSRRFMFTNFTFEWIISIMNFQVHFFENICSHKLHIWIARIKIKSTSVYPWTVVLNRKVVGLKARGLIWPIIYSDSIAMHRPSKQGLKVNLTMRIIESLSKLRRKKVRVGIGN